MNNILQIFKILDCRSKIVFVVYHDPNNKTKTIIAINNTISAKNGDTHLTPTLRSFSGKNTV